MRRLALAALLAVAAVPARADRRPADAVAADRRLLEIEKETLARRKADIEGSLDERRAAARARVRGLVRLSNGGFARILVGATNPSDYYRRRDVLARVVGRDAAEARALREELHEVVADRVRIDDLERRVRVLDTTSLGPPAFAIQPHSLARPVDGPQVAAFGPTHDVRTGAELSRDGILLATRPGESVVAPATGGVLGVVDVPGGGKAVVMDHGGGWRSVVAGLATVRVATGGYVVTGGEIGRAFGSTVEMQLLQDGTWIDPAPWLAPRTPLVETRPGEPAAAKHEPAIPTFTNHD